MKHLLRVIYILFPGLLLFFSLQSFKKLQMNHSTTKLHTIRDSIYFIEGHGGNIGVYTGEEGTLIIDNQFGYLHSEILDRLKEINDQPVKYLINTHWHVDHTDGNEKFGKEGAVIIA